ncbi:MAG: hypothetical protein ACTTI5_02275 [Treponema sp.]
MEAESVTNKSVACAFLKACLNDDMLWSEFRSRRRKLPPVEGRCSS